ncbi:MAG: hypothetical protein JW719_06680 [Pirellulales bacterium]|nr:hypothetical protein [Pirellulales bacterium]
MLVSNLDVRTKSNVRDSMVSSDELYHVERRVRRSPGGTNFLHNQEVFRAMYNVSAATGDTKYATFADNNMQYAMTHFIGPNSMFIWGWHQYIDVRTESKVYDYGDHHEIHATISPLWDRMYSINPTAVTMEIEQIWQRHVVNKTTGEINRHDDNKSGKAFLLSSGAFIEAFGFMYSKTNNPVWLARAKLLANYNWNRRNSSTNLMPDEPRNADGRFDGVRASTTTPGIYAPALYRAYELTGDALFQSQATTLIDSWADRAYDSSSGSYWGSLALNGTPIPGPRLTNPDDYAAYEARGLVDLWQPDLLAYEYTTETALSFAKRYAETGLNDYRTTADRWAKLIRDNLPAAETLDVAFYGPYSDEWAQYGAYAGQYGRVAEFFLTMYDATNEDHYLFSARDVAKEAVSNLWYEGLFRGHANKPYYEAVDGVGLLMDVLVQLDARAGDFELFGDFNLDGTVNGYDRDILISHWSMQVDPYVNGDVTGDGFVDSSDLSRFESEYLSVLPGDADGNGYVDEDDAAILAENWGAANVSWDMGDFNDDHVVNAADAALLAAHWLPRGTTEGTAPEPSLPVMVGIATAMIALRRRIHGIGTGKRPC